MCVKTGVKSQYPGPCQKFRHKRGSNTCSHRFKILSLFDYCDIAWSNLLQQHIDRLQLRLQRLQNRSARIITRCSRSSEAKEQLHWPTLSSRRSYHKGELVFLCSVFTHQFLVNFYYILLDFRTFTIIPQGKV